MAERTHDAQPARDHDVGAPAQTEIPEQTAVPGQTADGLDGVLHDIRHSAATVRLLARVLQDHRGDTAATRAATEGIADCANVITQLVDRARSTSVTRLDLVVDNVADQTRLLHQGRLIVVTEPALVLARRVDLMRIMTNLLDNAREATDHDEIIAVFVSVAGERAVVRVTNPSDASRSPQQGTGLSVVRRLVERLGGTLSVDLRDAEVEAVAEFPRYLPQAHELPERHAQEVTP